MISTDWRSFVPLVRMSTVKCPISAMIAKIRDAAREFCARSRVWVIVSDTADLYAGEEVYGLRPPSGVDFCDVLTVRHKGRRIEVRTPEQWRALGYASADTPQYFTVTEPGLVRLYPVPNEDQAGVLLVEVVAQPSVKSTQAPAFLLNRYGSIIAQGALARLLLIPDRPWTDMNSAVVSQRLFEDGIAGARITMEQGGGGASTTVRYRPFF